MKVKSVLNASEILGDEDSEAFLLSGSALSYQLLGQQNEGLLSLSEYLRYFDYLRVLTDRPFLLDGQAGFGNPLNTAFAVKEMENHGGDVILINDQKHPSHSEKDKLKNVSLPELAGRLSSAVDSSNNEFSKVWLKLDCFEDYSKEELEKIFKLAYHLKITDVLVNTTNKVSLNSNLNLHSFDKQTNKFFN